MNADISGHTLNDDSRATALLVSRINAKGLRPLKASEFWSLPGHIGTASMFGLHQMSAQADLSGSTSDGSGSTSDGSGSTSEGKQAQKGQAYGGGGPGVLLDRTAGRCLPAGLADRVVHLMGRATALAFDLERLQRSGIATVTVFDEHYPRLWLQRLEAKAPPLIYAAGAVDLLDIPGLGVVGNRDVSEAGRRIAIETARIAARRSLPLVSGGARGVDQIAMDAAFQAGGSVVGILAESLSRKLKRPDVRRAVHDERVVMCTPYNPDAPFNVGNAMGRNKLIYAQTALTVVVASSDGSGGTWSGATETIRNGYNRVAVWRGDGEGPGNARLQEQGAIPVSSPDEIESLLDGAHQTTPLSHAAAQPSETHEKPLQRPLFELQNK